VAFSSGNQKTVAISKLVPGKYQPRTHFEEDAIEGLASSIKEKGILQPILVRPHPDRVGEYEIIAGERRWQASQRAQLHEVPVIIKDMDDRDAAEIALVENLQRQDLSPLEEAEGYNRLMAEFSHTQEALSKALGKSRSHVANMMRLLALPSEVKSFLEDGLLSTGHARALLNCEQPAEIAKQIIKKGLNVRQTESLVKTAGVQSRPKAKKEKDTDTIALERDLTDLLGVKVDIKASQKGGALTLHYGSLEQLDDLLHRLSHGQHGKTGQAQSEELDPVSEYEVEEELSKL
jgi:ParB family chromosome partitioning protein